MKINKNILTSTLLVMLTLSGSIKYIKVIKYENVIELALLLAVIVPFLLPRLHERYFFMADIISLLYAFCFPKNFILP